jgi:hypothetical protein
LSPITKGIQMTEEEAKQKMDDKVIFRLGNMNHEGCDVWEKDGNKYMCFWDPVIERYTTCINPMITYRRGLN